MKKFILIYIVLLFSLKQGIGAVYNSWITGNWNSTSTWVGPWPNTIPSTTDTVNIFADVYVTDDATISSVTIKGGARLYTGTTGAGANKTLTITGLFSIENGGYYHHNNNQYAATTVFAGTEVFNWTSNIYISNWSSVNDNLIAGISSNFGNVFLNWNTGGALWNNNGLGSVRFIQGNLETSYGCKTFLDNTSSDVLITIGGTVRIRDEFRAKTSNSGSLSFFCGYLKIQDSTALFIGNFEGTGNTSVGSIITISAGTFYGVYNGTSNFFLNAGSSNFTQSGGKFYGIYNTTSFAAGVPRFLLENLTFSGGTFIGNYSCHTGNGIIPFKVYNTVNINFPDSSTVFAINKLAVLGSTPTTLGLKLEVGSLSISGAGNGEFICNNGSGADTINITGALVVNKGRVYFNVTPGFGSNGHHVSMNIGFLSILGGTTYLSSEIGTLTLTVANTTAILSGTLIAKANTGSANINFNSYNQSGGTFFLYNNTTVASHDVVTVNVNGNFTQSNGIINFSNNLLSGNATNVLAIKGSSYLIGVGGSITRGGALLGSQFGSIVFNAAGTTTYNRTGSHSVQQVKQSVRNGTTLNAASSIQVASHVAAGTDYFSIDTGGVVTLAFNQFYSDTLAANSGISVNDGGRLRLQHTAGLYNNAIPAAINHKGNMDYSLGPNSIVEYYGTGTQELSGINMGIATGTQHKYGILDINFNGPANTTWVYPTISPSPNTAIYIRTQLRLTSGQLNLSNNSGVAANGGRTITIENSSPIAITRTNGYIKSECQDLSAIVKWLMGTSSGIYVVPFGYDASNYIPVTLDALTGTSGTASFTTYHTPPNNLPWPPGVTNLNSGAWLSPDNRDATVDRFWFTMFSGIPAATLKLTYTTTEIPVSPYNNTSALRAQRYNPGSFQWLLPIIGQTTGVNSITLPSTPSWGLWAIANIASPLPVELLSFNAVPTENNVILKWSTASETDNDYFTVQRTTDFNNIKSFEPVKGSLHSTAVLYYSLTDEEPEKGVSYYRLMQTDINGDSESTKWIAVNYEPSTVAFFPNPASDYIFFNSDVKEFRLINALGENVLIPVLNNRADVKHLQPGYYMLQVNNGYKLTSKPLLIQ